MFVLFSFLKPKQNKLTATRVFKSKIQAKNGHYLRFIISIVEKSCSAKINEIFEFIVNKWMQNGV